MMKKYNIVILIVIFSMLLLGCSEKTEIYKAGTYTGVAEGQHGQIKVEVSIDEYNITNIEILEEYVLPEIGEVVFIEIPAAVIKYNNTNVDVVAGATYSSEVLIEAIDIAVNKAKLEISED